MNGVNNSVKFGRVLFVFPSFFCLFGCIVTCLQKYAYAEESLNISFNEILNSVPKYQWEIVIVVRLGWYKLQEGCVWCTLS
jgi:hypothetical protein